LHKWAAGLRLSIPAFSKGLRSLNLATSVGIATYEALRSIRKGAE
jgi:tRNA(Leu) C34 or U34 (ribose-2'-O)-methylase TrmL